jgi:hypothetical protein
MKATRLTKARRIFTRTPDDGVKKTDCSTTARGHALQPLTNTALKFFEP